MEKIKLSIVIPVHNEEKNLEILYKELRKELKKLNRNYEIIFVDDGSKDRSFSILKRISKKSKKVKVIRLMKNYGQSTAIYAGVLHSKGEYLITMDADLQFRPSDVKKFVKKLEEGWDVVCGWRVNKKKIEGVKNYFFTWVFNFLCNKIGGLKLHDVAGGMRGIRKKVFENIVLYGEFHRYLPLLANSYGFKVTEVKINLRKRRYGKSKYNTLKIIGGFLDFCVAIFLKKYFLQPFRFFGLIGSFLMIIGFLLGFFLLIKKLVYNISLLYVHGPLVLLASFLFLTGLQIFALGLIGEIVRTPLKKSLFVVAEKINV